MPDSASSDDFWKRKLAAFLHDPPSKALDIGTHWEVARAAYSAAGFTEEEISDYEKAADHTAAAADRLPFPNHQASGMRCHFDGKRNAFRHPLSGYKLEFTPFQTADLAIEGQQTVQPIIQDFGSVPETKRWRARHFAHWRLWREHAQGKDWRLGFLPADTRIPDHSIWHHMGMVSALAGCMEKNSGESSLRPAFLKVQIGPVQEMIASARSVRDLWSGSYLLSWLMAAAMKALSAEIGPDAVIFPSLYGQPLFDLHWRDELWNHVKIGSQSVWESWGYDHRKRLLVPNLPNVFLALVPAARGAELGQLVERAIRDEWASISKASWDYCDSAVLPDQITNLTADEGVILREDREIRFHRQIDRFLQISWQADPWPDSLQSALALAHGGFSEDMPVAKAAVSVQTIVKMATQQMDRHHRDRRYYTDDSKAALDNIGAAWSVLLQHASWKLDAVRQTRDFQAWTSGGWGSGAANNKDSLTGREEAVAGGEVWLDRCQKLGGTWSSLFKKTDRIGAVTLVKRVWHLAYLRNEKWKLHTGHGHEFPMPNTHGIAAGRPNDDDERDTDDITDDEKYFAVLAFDGDEIGKWVSGEKTPGFEKVLADYTDATGGIPQGSAPYFRRPEFADFLNRRRPLAPGFHLQFSETLSNFAQHAASPVVEYFNGRLIYAGGDDVLAMVPADKALKCAEALRAAFRGDKKLIPGLEQKADGFLISDSFRQATGRLFTNDEEKIPYAVPGPVAEVSVGIAIAHFKSPLQDVVRAAQAAEKRAKNKLGRAAAAVSLFKRSGEITEWGCQWESDGLAFYDTIAASLQSGGVSAKFPHRVCELLKPYRNRTGCAQALTDSPDFDAAEIIRKEFAFAISRQSQDGKRQTNEKVLLPLLNTYLEKLTENRRMREAKGMAGKLSPSQELLEAIDGLCSTVAFAHRTRAENPDADRQPAP